MSRWIVVGCLMVLAWVAGCSRPAPSASVAASVDAAATVPATVYRWKLITTWPKNFPALGTAPERLADNLRAMSNGRLDISVYGAGELVGAFEVLRRAGGIPVALPATEIFTAMQTGAIDATEWVGPYNDLALGLHRVAKYYYYPGWHEPGATTEVIINKVAWDGLPADLQAMVQVATRAMNDDMLSEFTARNSAALTTLVVDHGVQLRRLPDDVLDEFRLAAAAVVEETAQNNELAGRIYRSYMNFLNEVRAYHEISERAYINAR